MARGYYEEEYEEEPSPRRRKKGHRLYAFTVLVLGLAILALSLIVFFHIQKVQIDGNEYCSDQQILEMVQSDRYSSNSLYVCIRYALGYGETLPCLEEVKVGLSLPWELKVEVKEKPIVGYVYTADSQYAYFDTEGLVVKEDVSYIEGVPCVEGIDVGDVELYKPITSEDKEIFEKILETSGELSRYELEADRVICGDGRIFVYVGNVCIALGDSVTSEKIAQIPPILEKLDGQEGTLHLENYAEGRETITFDIGEFPETGVTEPTQSNAEENQ